MQACNIYIHKVDTVSNHITTFFIENVAPYIVVVVVVVVVNAIYSSLVKTHLMTNALYFCGFLALIIIQLTLAS